MSGNYTNNSRLINSVSASVKSYCHDVSRFITFSKKIFIKNRYGYRVNKISTSCSTGVGENVAGVWCSHQIADLVFDHLELERTAHLQDRHLYWLQCAMEENCVASQAYQIQRDYPYWHLETRRLLRFTARILNAGTADFRPAVPKHLWEWHMCHRFV